MTQTLTITKPSMMVPVKSEYAIALRGQKISDVSDMELDVAITGAILQGNLDMGLRNLEDKDTNYMCDKLMQRARKSFGALTLDEIITAIGNGVEGKYDKDRPMKTTVVLVVSWWKAYMTDHLRIEAKALLEKETQAVIVVSDDERRKVYRARIVNAFAEYKETGKFSDHGSLVFDLINKTGRIPFDDKTVLKIWDQARSIAIANLSRPVISWDLRKSMKHALDQLLLKGETKLIEIEAKRITLFAFFDHLIAIDADIIEFLTK